MADCMCVASPLRVKLRWLMICLKSAKIAVSWAIVPVIVVLIVWVSLFLLFLLFNYFYFPVFPDTLSQSYDDLRFDLEDQWLGVTLKSGGKGEKVVVSYHHSWYECIFTWRENFVLYFYGRPFFMLTSLTLNIITIDMGVLKISFTPPKVGAYRLR